MTPPKTHPIRTRLLTLGLNVCALSASSVACQGLREAQSDGTLAAADSPATVRLTLDETLANAIVDAESMGDATQTIVGPTGDKARCREAEAYLSRRLVAAPALSRDAADRALTLYLLCPSSNAPDVYEALMETSPSAAWRVAQARPSQKMAERIGRRLSKALTKTGLDGLATPDAARAIRANRVAESYTFLRQALALSGHGAFIEAMIALEPERVGGDATAYLARATAEELRSGALRNVDATACVTVLEFFERKPPSLKHPNVGHLFLYAIAQDDVLSAHARAVLVNMAATHAPELAAALASMARDVQLAFVSSLSAAQPPSLVVLRQELRSRTTDAEIAAVLDGQSTTR